MKQPNNILVSSIWQEDIKYLIGRLLLLGYCFQIFKLKNIMPLKTKLIIRKSKLIKCNLQNIDLYGSDSIKWKIEISEKSSVLL